MIGSPVFERCTRATLVFDLATIEANLRRVADAAQLLGVSRKGLFLKRRRAGMLDNEEA